MISFPYKIIYKTPDGEFEFTHIYAESYSTARYLFSQNSDAVIHSIAPDIQKSEEDVAMLLAHRVMAKGLLTVREARMEFMRLLALELNEVIQKFCRDNEIEYSGDPDEE